MKTTRRIDLYNWQQEWGRDEIDIPWPSVQKQVGREQLDWLLKQPKTHCQLVVDKLNQDCKLIAEFYEDSVAVNYYLLWAK